MRLAIGAILFEGNTFSPVIAGRDAFAGKYLCRGDEIPTRLAGTGTEMGGALSAAGDAVLVPLLATHGGAGGRVDGAFTRALVAELEQRLLEAGQLDGIYLALHGAYVSEDSLDFEGDLLPRIRRARPGLPIVVSCDLHGHITPAMTANCDALIGYKHYPHDDTFETGAKAVSLLRRIVAGAISPVVRCCRAPMLLPAQKQGTRGAGPMVAVRALAERREAGAVLDVSYFCVQPWLDAPDVGFTAVVTADRDGTAAESVAREVAALAWERRRDFLVETWRPDEAIARGLALDGQIVLADSADCVGGGSTGDSTAVLAALLRAGGGAAMQIVDAESATLARRLGVGGRGVFRLGNKRDPAYGEPVEAEATVTGLCGGSFTYAGGIMKGVAAEMGDAAVLQVGAVRLLVTSTAFYEYADEAFAAAGIDARAAKFLVAKNPMNYQQAYPDAAGYFILRTPGATSPDLAGLPWRLVRRPIFPLDDAAPVFTVF